MSDGEAATAGIPAETWEMIRRVDPLGRPEAFGEAQPEEFSQRGRTDDGSGSSRSRTPLEIVKSSLSGGPAILIIYGTVDGARGDDAMTGGADQRKAVSAGGNVWIQFACEDDGEGNWTRTGDPETHTGTLPSATDVLAVLNLGEFSMASGAITTVGAAKPGSVGWERCGPADNFHDRFPAGS